MESKYEGLSKKLLQYFIRREDDSIITMSTKHLAIATRMTDAQVKICFKILCEKNFIKRLGPKKIKLLV